MGSFRTVNSSGVVKIGHPAAAPDEPVLKAVFDTLVDEVEGVAALIATETEIRVTENSVLISQISILSGSVGANAAAIVTERNLRVSEDEAFAEVIEELTATVNGNSAAISSLSQVLSTVSGSQSTRIDTLFVNFGSFQSTVTSQFTAFANADGALASQIDTLAVSVAGNTASITEEAEVRAAADGAIHARWGVAIDINGRISGIELLDGSDGESTFTIRADNFQIVNPSYPDNPFPSKVVASASFGTRFRTNLGSGEPNEFTGGNGTVSRNADVALLGELVGVGYGTGFNLGRLRYAGTNTFLASFSGQCRQASIWYRVVTQHDDWRIYAALGWLAPSSGTGNFHTVVGSGLQDLSVGATDRIQFGFNGLDGNGDGDTDDDSNNDIYSGEMLLEVDNF